MMKTLLLALLLLPLLLLPRAKGTQTDGKLKRHSHENDF
jgi:hypothetical protein